ncbi:MAG TPA: glutathione peroxidase [Caulobacterales bacterium]|nr:glutathione peroxidase [Caulobacterales bacterium]
MTGIYDFPLKTLSGGETNLAEHRGKVLLIVNTASLCGFTPQYGDLETLYRKYKDRGFVVLGFPCNQFGKQEPGDAKDIAAFCSTNYGVTFPLFAKVDVNGPGAAPLFDYLKHEKRGFLGSKAIKWNFTKFLIARDGATIARFAPNRTPASLQDEIEKALG